jgi:hypothetical protein
VTTVFGQVKPVHEPAPAPEEKPGSFTFTGSFQSSAAMTPLARMVRLHPEAHA